MISQWLLPASLTLVCWGIWSFVPKITTRYIRPMSAIVYEVIGAIIVGAIILAHLDFRPDTNPKGICLAVFTGIVGFTGALGFLFAVKYQKVSVIAMFTSLSPVITLTLGWLLLKEPITLKEGLGIISAFAAIYFFAS